MEITKEMWLAATGYAAVDDDLERANCPKAGQIGHHGCGWCSVCDKPNLYHDHSKCS